jgi:hypothetical protein
MRSKPVRCRHEGRTTPSASQRRPPPLVAPERGEQLEAVQIAANSYCLRHYGISYSGGTPRRLSFRSAEVWIVPALLTSPGYGVVGEVGLVAIDAATQEVVAATPAEEVRAAGSGLAEAKQDELEAAFRQARKA